MEHSPTILTLGIVESSYFNSPLAGNSSSAIKILICGIVGIVMLSLLWNDDIDDSSFSCTAYNMKPTFFTED